MKKSKTRRLTNFTPLQKAPLRLTGLLARQLAERYVGEKVREKVPEGFKNNPSGTFSTFSMVSLQPKTRNLKLHMLCFILFLTISFEAIGGDDAFAYLILKASVVDETEQPTYICLYRKGRCTHVEANSSFAKVRPGHYKLAHVDFGKNIASGKGTIFFDNQNILKVKSGKVYFIGNLILSDRSVGKLKMKFEQTLDFFKDACKSLPEPVKTFPLANAKNGNEIKLNCTNVL